MLTGKKLILFGAGIIGRRALNFFGPDKVYCFADNKKAGQDFWGKQVISFEKLREICGDYDVILSVSIASRADLEKQCKDADIQYSVYNRLVSHEDYGSNPAIRVFMDKHKGLRCFLIGNGPSLRAEDLTKLHQRGEICFGCNRIEKIYDKTPWRPMYYMAGDPALFLESGMLAKTDAEYRFFPELNDIYANDETDIRKSFDRNCERNIFYKQISADVNTLFSPDVSKAFYHGCTIMYRMIQLAVYMGFTDIYLLGVDGTGSTLRDPKEYLSENRHFYEDDENWVREKSVLVSQPDAETAETVMANAFDKANEYTKERGIKIYNATRGGKLEAFERADFDLLFREK